MIEGPNDHRQLIELLWVKASERLFITKEKFVDNLEGWVIEPVTLHGDLSFVTLTKGAAFHFVSMGTRHPLSSRMIADFLQAIIAEHGFATTKTPKEDMRQRRFNERFGFEMTGEDEYDIHYRIERLRRCH